MDAEELATTARMARLALNPGEIERLRIAVERMLSHFSHMKELNVEGLAPTTHALVRQNRTREDQETPPASALPLLENAPRRDEQYIVIPNVL